MNEELMMEKEIIEETKKTKHWIHRALLKFHKDLKRRVAALELRDNENVWEMNHLKDALKVKDHQIRELEETVVKLSEYLGSLQDVMTGCFTKIEKRDNDLKEALRVTQEGIFELLSQKDEGEEDSKSLN
jgi:Mg2+ and Co2+ transporter CorA